MRSVNLIAVSLIVAGQLAASAPELSPDLFDEIATHSDANIHLHGLAALYPGRVLFEEPALLTNQERSEPAKVETIRDEIRYIRVYRLEDALETIREHLTAPSLILDLRYTQSPSLAAELSFDLDGGHAHQKLTAVGTLTDPVKAALFAETDALNSVGKSPIVVLCNRETAGPYEALLHNLQASGAIIAVGETTAGRTGFYKKVDDFVWLLNGEVRPNASTSLIGEGFEPRISVNLSAEQHYTAYHWYEAGSSLDQILKNIQSTAEAPDPHPAIDPILERGVEIVAALQILR